MVDLTGIKFGCLLPVFRTREHNLTVYQCRCDCGRIVTIRHGNLQAGQLSCGCYRLNILRTINITHGESKRSAEYRVWRGIKQRCENPNCKDYPNYGGRGIAVWPEWSACYESFLAYVGRRPNNSHQIERLDNSKGYEPGNVTWATPTQQGRNKRNNRMVTCYGETLTLSTWAERLQVSPEALADRLKTMPESEALTPGDARSRSRHPLRRLLTFDGMTMNLTQWAKRLDITPGSLCVRLQRWTINKALTRPRRQR